MPIAELITPNQVRLLPQSTSNVSYVGNLLIFAVGWNLIHGEKLIRVANLLPSLIIAAVWSLVF